MIPAQTPEAGLQPKAASFYLEQELRDWAELGVEGHFHATNPWMPYHRLLTQQTAELVGAEESEVVTHEVPEDDVPTEYDDNEH